MLFPYSVQAHPWRTRIGQSYYMHISRDVNRSVCRRIPLT